MNTRVDAYVKQFEEVRQEFIAAVEGFSPEQMQARCAGEQCTVAALASHIAGVHILAAGWVQTAAAGEPLPPITIDMVHAMNAEQFARDAGRPKDEILASLRQNGPVAAEVLRNLTDDQLDRSSYFEVFKAEVTTDKLVQGILIGDVQNHSASIRAATRQTAAA